MKFNQKKFVGILGFMIANKLAENAPKATGNLARSFIGTFTYTEEQISFSLPNYWQGVEFGVLPHIIRPKKADGALYWKGAKHPMKLVHHPGNKPNPFVRNTINNLPESMIEKALEASFK